MKIVTDLHMHSTCSDGKYSPGIIVEKIIKAGLSTFALSYHDTLDHIPIIKDYIKNNLLVTDSTDYHGWGNKISIRSFGIDANYLRNFTELLN